MSGVEERGRVTLRDVAREAGVSYATASRALNGSDRSVRAENALRVRAAADRLGYLPSLPAQAVARGSTRTVALVISDMDDPYFASLAAGVTDAAEESGLIVTMAVADRTPDLEVSLVHRLRGHRPRVIVIAGSRIGDHPSPSGDALTAELTAYRNAGGRVALISQEGLPFPTVSVDNYGGARALARTLADLGLRRFAVVHSGDRIRTSADRRHGFTDGLLSAGLAPPALIETEFSRAGGRRAGALIPADTDAVFAVNDIMAIGLMTGLRAAGRRPGRDIAVAGFDDVEEARYATPPLTTVHIPLREVGRLALETALAPDPAQVVPVPVRVVLRDSTAQEKHH